MFSQDIKLVYIYAIKSALENVCICCDLQHEYCLLYYGRFQVE